MKSHKGTFQRLPRAAMQPLRIRAYLQAPVISDGTLPIDAALYYEAMRARYGEQYMTTPGSAHSDARIGVQLPLARCEEHGPQWYYAASFAQWPEAPARGKDFWNKRTDFSLIDLVDWRGCAPRVDITSGTYKSYHMPVWYAHAVYLEWYVVGYAPGIEPLLAQVTHLGKKTAQGWGAVLRWEMRPWAADWSVRGPDGRLMRAVPAAQGQCVGYRPSYWLPKNQAVCEVPGGPEELNGSDRSAV